MNASIATAFALLVDEVIPEPPNRFHPVAWFGTTMLRYEARWYRDNRWAGVCHALAGTSLGLATGWLLRRLLGRTVATFIAVTIATGGAMLREVAGTIGAATDLDEARRGLPALVGRDPRQLDSNEIARATVESVAENTVDAVICSAFWAAIGGAPAVLAHRAVNTMDAMVGHHSDRYENYGWASARLDDLMAWVPARLTALAVALARPSRSIQVAQAVTRDAPGHPSPNSGVAEAAFAAALGVRLGGVNRYGASVEHRALLHPAGRPPELADVKAANRLSRQVGFISTAVLMAGRMCGRRAPEGYRRPFRRRGGLW